MKLHDICINSVTPAFGGAEGCELTTRYRAPSVRRRFAHLLPQGHVCGLTLSYGGYLAPIYHRPRIRAVG